MADQPSGPLTDIYVIPSGRGLPQLPSKLNPQLLAVVVNNPPFVNEGRSAPFINVIQAWQPPDPPPVQRGKLSPQFLAVPVNAPPFVNEGRNIAFVNIIQAWQPPDPQPAQKIKLSAQILAVQVNNPPFVNEGLGQAQSQIARAWLSFDPLPTLPVKLVPSAQTVPPFTTEEIDEALAIIIQAWQPADPLPQLPRNLNPQLLAVTVNNPPFGQRDQRPNILYAWQPPDPLPTLPTKVPQPNPPSADNPPFGLLVTVIEPWIPEWWPTQPRYKITPATVIVVNNPPFGQRNPNPNILYAWQPPDPPPVQKGPLNPSLTAVPVNNPPFSQRNSASAILLQWQLPDPLPTLPKLLSPGTPGQSVDNPPGLRRLPVTWLDQLPLPQTTAFLPQGTITAAAQGSFTNQWLVSILQAWQPADPLPQLPPNKLIVGIAVNNPPPFTYQWLVPILQSWQPSDPLPQLPQNKLITGATINNPPFSYPGRSATAVTIIQAWQPPDPQPVQRGPLSPQLTAVRVDNPPVIGFSPQFWSILATWEIPLPPQPQQTKYIVTIIPPPPPSTEIHDHPWFVTFGKMTVH